MLERISYSEDFPKECGSSQRTELATAADDLISRQAAIDALWKALYEYEDKTEKQFQESEDLDIEDWIVHRIFAQDMSAEDMQAIIDLPPAQHWIPCSERLPKKSGDYLVTVAHHSGELWVEVDQFDNKNGSWWHYMDDVTAWMPRPKPYKGEES